MKIRPLTKTNGMTLIEIILIQAEVKYKELILPIFISIVMAILRLLHVGERGLIAIITNVLFAGLFGWLTYFILVQKFSFSYEIASGACGVSGYLSDKVIKWLPKFADDAAEKLEDKINHQD